MRKHFITVGEVKELTDIQTNVNNQFLEPRIPRAEENDLKPVLGPLLYKELQDAIDSEAMAEARITALLVQLKPMLAQWVFVRSIPYISTHITNMGLKQTGIESTSSDRKELTAAVEQEAVYRTNELKDWLEAHKADYPTYSATEKEVIDEIPGLLYL